jgi:hypothetical protein
MKKREKEGGTMLLAVATVNILRPGRESNQIGGVNSNLEHSQHTEQNSAIIQISVKDYV